MLLHLLVVQDVLVLLHLLAQLVLRMELHVVGVLSRLIRPPQSLVFILHITQHVPGGEVTDKRQETGDKRQQQTCMQREKFERCRVSQAQVGKRKT